MNPKRISPILIVIVLVVTLVGCNRPASQNPTGATATVASGDGIPVPGGSSTQTMGPFEQLATETAQAAIGNNPPPVQATSTPMPPAVTDTPAAPPPQPVAATATSGAVVVPAATAGIPTSYTLQKDEFPYCIARRFDVNPYELLSLNGLSQSQTIFSPGLVLKIPQTGHNFPGERSLKDHPTTYTVKSGDTIYKVACYFGDVDPLVIALVNGLSSPYTLTAGNTITIP